MTSWRISPRVAYTGDAKRVALIHLDRLGEPVRALEGTGAAIWDAMLTHGAGETPEYHDEKNLIVALCERFDVSPETISDQVIAFLRELNDQDLVERSEEE